MTKKDFDAKILRTLGNTFSVGASGLIDNTLRLSLTNRSAEPRTYKLQVVSPAGGQVRSIEQPEISLAASEHRYVPILVSADFAISTMGVARSNCVSKTTAEKIALSITRC